MYVWKRIYQVIISFYGFAIAKLFIIRTRIGLATMPDILILRPSILNALLSAWPGALQRLLQPFILPRNLLSFFQDYWEDDPDERH